MIYRSKYRHNLTDIVVQQLHLILHNIYIFSNLIYFLYIRQHIYNSSKQISILKTCNSQEKRKSFRIFQLKLLFVKINQTTQGQIYSLYVWCVLKILYNIRHYSRYRKKYLNFIYIIYTLVILFTVILLVSPLHYVHVHFR